MSDIRANTISDAAGTGPIDLYKQSAAKVWVNFNGTGTIAVRDSLNVSSLTDIGTGQYTVSFTASLADTSYSAVANGGNTDLDGAIVNPQEYSTTSIKTIFRVLTNAVDFTFCNLTVTR